jgi:hypothetical protein
MRPAPPAPLPSVCRPLAISLAAVAETGADEKPSLAHSAAVFVGPQIKNRRLAPLVRDRFGVGGYTAQEGRVNPGREWPGAASSRTVNDQVLE